MLADKVRNVLDTGAEVCSAVDNSCLLHIGGALSRLRSGVRTAHLADILARRHEGASRPQRATALAEHAAPAQPRPRDQHDPRSSRARAVAERARLGGAPRGRRRASSAGCCGTSTGTCSSSRRRSSARAATSTGRATRAEAHAWSPSSSRADRRARRRQGQVADDGRDRAERGARPRGHRRGRDRPRRADRPARGRGAVAHPRPGDPQEPRRDPRPLSPRVRTARALGRAAGARRRRPRAPAREVPRPRGSAISGANFGDRRDRHRLRRRVGGQRPLLHDAARDADHGRRDREARCRRPRTSRSSSSSCRARRPASA